jgi:cytochrome oxidase Cu insertion factor (SCO1/SenC/PrrC family)
MMSTSQGDRFQMSRVFSGPGRTLGPGLLALSLAFGVAASQPPNPPAAAVDLDTVGPQVGDPLRDFSLRDQGGQERSLKSLLGAKGAVIVFYRSADW